MTHHEFLLFALGADFGVLVTFLAYFGAGIVDGRRNLRAIEAAECLAGRGEV